MAISRNSVRVKRVYEDAKADDGYRVLVDRLWPRGVSRDEAAIDLWLKNVAPSTGLRRWFHADRERWPEFRKRYKTELSTNPAFAELCSLVREHGGRGQYGVTLLYATRDPVHNHAVVLRDTVLDS